MAELLDTQTLRARYDIHRDVADERLQTGLRKAARRLREWVGAELYAAVVAQNTADTSGLTAAEVERLADFTDAEADLAMHYLILSLQTQVRRQGIVAEEKLSEGGTIIRLHNAQAMQVYIAEYLQQAEEAIQRYRVPTLAPTYDFSGE